MVSGGQGWLFGCGLVGGVVRVGPSGNGLVWGTSDPLWGYSKVTDFQNSNFAASRPSLVDVGLLDSERSVWHSAIRRLCPAGLQWVLERRQTLWARSACAVLASVRAQPVGQICLISPHSHDPLDVGLGSPFYSWESGHKTCVELLSR